MKTKELELTRKVLTVSLRPNASSGGGEFDIKNFSEAKEYRVFGAVKVTYGDRSSVICWLVEDNRGVVSPKDMAKFVIQKVEEEKEK